MKVSITIEDMGGMSWPLWKQMVPELESMGFAAIYRSDHFPIAAEGVTESLELITALSYLVEHTRRVDFGSLVAPLSVREPVMLARQKRRRRDDGDLLSQRGQVHLVGRGAAIGGLVAFLSDVFRLEVVLGTGAKNAEPGAELDGLLVAGVVKCAADRRIEHLVEQASSLRGAAGGVWSWLKQPLT